MKIELKRMNDAVHFVAQNEEGLSISFDGGPKIGGEGKGVRPMESVLMAVAACSSIDVVEILKKMRQPLRDLEVSVHGERDTDKVPAVFTKIKVHYILYGDLDPEKAQRAVDLSMSTYCSVSKMLEASVEISHDLTLKP